MYCLSSCFNKKKYLPHTHEVVETNGHIHHLPIKVPRAEIWYMKRCVRVRYARGVETLISPLNIQTESIKMDRWS